MEDGALTRCIYGRVLLKSGILGSLTFTVMSVTTVDNIDNESDTNLKADSLNTSHCMIRCDSCLSSPSIMFIQRMAQKY